MIDPAAVARACLCAAAACVAACGNGDTTRESVSTSIRPADCTAPPADVAATYTARDLGVQQCPAPGGWRLLLVASDSNTWLEIQGPSLTWSAERPVVYESPLGLFPSVGGTDTVEWRGDARGKPSALIFRVTAQRRDDPTARESALFVTRIDGTRACVLGRAPTIEAARALADSSKRC
jgi:hypothetical protein